MEKVTVPSFDGLQYAMETKLKELIQSKEAVVKLLKDVRTMKEDMWWHILYFLIFFWLTIILPIAAVYFLASVPRKTVCYENNYYSLHGGHMPWSLR